MTGTDSAKRQMIVVAAALLAQGSLIDRLSRCLTVASLVGTVGVALLVGRSGIAIILLLGAVALTGLVELWFSVRVAIDARLFQSLSAEDDGPDWTALDAALTGLGLMPPGKAGRPPELRIAGALRLLRYQAAALAVQFAFVFAGAAAGVAR